MINEKILHLGKERSAIRELFEQGKILKEKYGEESVFDFSIGNPSLLPPKAVNETIENLLKVSKIIDARGKNNIDIEIYSPNNDYKYRKLSSNDLHGYTSAQGDNEVRDAIKKHLEKSYGVELDKDLIYMLVGAAAGLSIAMNALISNKDDEVIVFAPFFPEYRVFIESNGGKCISVSPDYKTFYPDFDDFEKKINKNTVCVIINSPNNPTGVVYDEEVIKKICSVLKKKEKEYGNPIYIISDEPYRELIYNDKKSYPFITKYYDNSIINYSFSKSMSLPGERIGYTMVNPKAQDASDLYLAICGAGRAKGYVCAGTLFQFVIPHVLGSYSDFSVYKRNSQILYDALTKIGYEVVYPDGAFYLFVKALCEDGKEFSEKAMDYNLILVPSESFGIKGYFRIAYCVGKDKIEKSIEKFRQLYDFYKNK